MMISPDYYVKSEIKGKTPEKILSKIRGLQREIAGLKNKLESGQDFDELLMHPSPQVRIDMMREYAEAAELYLISNGREYEPSKLEQRASAFDDNLTHIRMIAVEYGGYFGGAERRTLTRDGQQIVIERDFYNGAFDDGRTLYEDMTWDELIEEISGIHMGEWKTKYNDPEVLDGTQWSVDIEYDNGSPAKHIWGSNKFPYNFERFLEVMEMD